MNKEIRRAELEDLDLIVNLLNRVTLKLHNKGIMQWTYPWNSTDVRQDIIEDRVYLLVVDEAVIGTFSIKNMEKLDFLSVGTSDQYLYRIAILPRYQGKSLGTAIIEYVRNYVKELNSSLYLDCWAGNEKLRNFYAAAGFIHLGDFPEEDYIISIFKYN